MVTTLISTSSSLFSQLLGLFPVLWYLFNFLKLLKLRSVLHNFLGFLLFTLLDYKHSMEILILQWLKCGLKTIKMRIQVWKNLNLHHFWIQNFSIQFSQIFWNDFELEKKLIQNFIMHENRPTLKFLPATPKSYF